METLEASERGNFKLNYGPMLLFIYVIVSIGVIRNSDNDFPWRYLFGFLIALMGASGLRGAIYRNDRAYLKGQVVYGLVLISLGCYLGSRSELSFTLSFDGLSWTVVGAVLAFLGTERRHAFSKREIQEGALEEPGQGNP